MPHALRLCRWKESFKSSNERLQNKIEVAGAVGLQQADVQGPIAYGARPPPPLPNQGESATQRQFNMGSQNIGGYTHSKSYIAAMIQSVPKSKKEQ
jgi:hypothetical protein